MNKVNNKENEILVAPSPSESLFSVSELRCLLFRASIEHISPQSSFSHISHKVALNPL